MTKEITKAYILQEMQDKLKLREWEPGAFLFTETVVPIYNIEPHLLKRKAVFISRPISGTGNKLCFTVPENERWVFDRYDVVFMGAGAYTVAGANVERKGFADPVYLDLTAAQTVSYHIGLNIPVTMDPGDRLFVMIDGYTSPQDLRLYLDYTYEVLR